MAKKQLSKYAGKRIFFLASAFGFSPCQITFFQQERKLIGTYFFH